MTIASTTQEICFLYSVRAAVVLVHSAWFAANIAFRPFCSAACFLSVAGPLSDANASFVAVPRCWSTSGGQRC